MGEVVTSMLSFRQLTHTRDGSTLHHEHCCVPVEVKGKAVWILNVLVDTTHHHGETETANQNNSLVDLDSRKGKGRAANGNWPIGAASCTRGQQIQGDMPTPPPRFPLDKTARPFCKQLRNFA